MKLKNTDRAPAAVGPYSQAVEVAGFLYTSGQIGLDPVSNEMVQGHNGESDFEAQAKQVLANLKAVLANSGCTFSDIVKATIYVTDMGNFGLLNDLYGAALGDHRPARSTVQAAALPKGALVEIDLVARLG